MVAGWLTFLCDSMISRCSFDTIDKNSQFVKPGTLHPLLSLAKADVDCLFSSEGSMPEFHGSSIANRPLKLMIHMVKQMLMASPNATGRSLLQAVGAWPRVAPRLVPC